MKEEKKHEENIDPKDKQIAELTDTLKRLQAEFENYKKRIEKESAEFKDYAKKELIIKILPLIDSFEQALKNTSNKENFVKGVELIFAQLMSILAQEGLRPIHSLHEKFDPFKHEVLLQKECDKEEGTVIEEFQKGYFLKDKVIRSSKVVISKKHDKCEHKC